MMINKESKKEDTPAEKEEGLVDTALMDVQCHLLIKDKDTNEVLVNKRG